MPKYQRASCDTLLAKHLVGLADEVRVSLDGLRDGNDVQRGRGNFDAALRALQTLYDVGFEPKVLITITAGNVDDLEALICLLFDRKFTRISLNTFRPIGRGEGHWDWRADPKQVRAALSRAWQRCNPNQPLPMEPVENVQCHCGVGQFLNILPNGDVFPCHVLTSAEFRCGNVREQNLLDICRNSGLIGQLAKLNFRELTRADTDLSELARPGACMGNIYAKTKDSPAWKASLPILE